MLAGGASCVRCSILGGRGQWFPLSTPLHSGVVRLRSPLLSQNPHTSAPSVNVAHEIIETGHGADKMLTPATLFRIDIKASAMLPTHSLRGAADTVLDRLLLPADY